MGGVLRVVTLDAKADKIKDMERVLCEDVVAMYHRNGCDHCHIGREQGRPTEFVVISIWHKGEDLANMRMAPEYAGIIAEVRENSRTGLKEFMYDMLA